LDDLDEDCNLDVAEMDDDDDTDEFADEFPESLDPTPDDAYEDAFGPHTADATSILADECLYSYEDVDFCDLADDPLDTIGIPRLPSQPNKGVRLNFEAILQFLSSIIHTRKILIRCLTTIKLLVVSH